MAVEQKVRLGLSITAQSFGFFKTHKWLVLFPIISLVVKLTLIIAVAVGIFEVAMLTDFLGMGADASQSTAAQKATEASGPTDEKTELLSVAGFAAMFCLSVCAYFVFNFFNVALAVCVLAIFRGEPSGIWGGISVAAHRLSAIFGWSVISAVIGTIASAIESRSEIVAAVLSVLAGLAWRMGTFFVIPIIASQKTGSVPAIKESVHIIRKVWGESVVSHLGLRGISFLFIIVFVSGALAVTHLSFGPEALMITAAVLTPLVLILILFMSTIGIITRAALFYYATEQTVPSQFDDDTLRKAITKKRTKA